MNKFEAVIILEPNTEETIIEEILELIKNKIEEDDGKVTNLEKIGLKYLAYEIKNNKQGYYIVIQFKSEQSTTAELERLFRITEEVMKFIVVRKDD